MTLRAQRCLFTRLLFELGLWIRTELESDVALDEARVFSPRAARLGAKRVTIEDAVHRRGSRHYSGLAADLLVYPDLDGDGERDDYLADGDHPIWLRIARKWESMHELCTSGIRFGDANHVSLGEGSKEEPLPALPED